MNWEIKHGSCLDVLKTLDSESVQCCVTSPPYWSLRDYGIDGQIGWEDSPEAFAEKLGDVFDEVRRILKDDGTLWLNLGDSYISAKCDYMSPQTINNGAPRGYITKASGAGYPPNRRRFEDYKQKDLAGIPWLVAFELRRRGWYLRADIIWNKPNPMPESVQDRPTKAHEYIFLLSKSKTYYYDHEAIKEPLKDESIARAIRGVSDSHKNVNGAPGQTPHTMAQPRPHKGRDRTAGNRNGEGQSTLDLPKNLLYKGQQPHSMHVARLNGMSDAEYAARKQFDPSQAGGGSGVSGHSGYFKEDGTPLCSDMANKKSVWTVTTRPFRDAHFATFPEKLIEPCVLAGSREGDLVLDPFSGAATTGLVSLRHRRNYLGIELNEKYIEISEKRLKAVQVELFV